jgi:monovalent cation/proton antiporter MnhG/PhaG subunit
MSGREVVEIVLLSLGVLAELLCCVGIVAFRRTYDRLHYVSAAGTVGPVLIASAIVVEHRLSAYGLKAILVALILVATGPVLGHALARAARVLEHGHTRSLPSERR